MDRLIPLLDENGLPFVSDTPVDEETWEAWERAYEESDAVNERLRVMARKHFPRLRP
jgi:hypothetical protein